jgi:hypothetical protein
MDNTKQNEKKEVKAMDTFKEMADIAIKEAGGFGLIILSINILFYVYLIVIHWIKWKQNQWSRFVGPTQFEHGFDGCDIFFIPFSYLGCRSIHL